MNKPFSEQVEGSQEIVVNYSEADPSVQHFLDEMEVLTAKSYGVGLNIRMISSENTTFADIIKIMALSFHEADRKLSEIMEMCTGKNNE